MVMMSDHGNSYLSSSAGSSKKSNQSRDPHASVCHLTKYGGGKKKKENNKGDYPISIVIER